MTTFEQFEAARAENQAIQREIAQWIDEPPNAAAIYARVAWLEAVCDEYWAQPYSGPAHRLLA